MRVVHSDIRSRAVVCKSRQKLCCVLFVFLLTLVNAVRLEMVWWPV